MISYWTALLLGLGGSLHCIGMCGPLMLALPRGRGATPNRVFGRLSYQAGRVTTYTMMGVAAGAIGGLVHWAGWQQVLSISLGIFLVLGVVGVPWWQRSRWGARCMATFTGWLSGMLRRPGSETLYAVGLINGFLPCGLVYVALAPAALTHSPVEGALMMAAFGLGTVPAMLAMSFGGQMVSPVWRMRLIRAVPVLVLALGVLLIVRGMGLNIEMVSPPVESGTVQSCCEAGALE